MYENFKTDIFWNLFKIIFLGAKILRMFQRDLWPEFIHDWDV